MLRPLGTALLLFSLAGCGAAGPGEAEWPPLAKKWFDRAQASFQAGDVEDAESAVEQALHADQHRPEIRILAARVALARLEYAKVATLLKGLESTEASSIRGRALWYSGDVEQAADELERLVADPEVRDQWATDIAKLSRRGVGRKPFSLSGAMVAVSEMPRVGSAALIVPLEISGEPALALIDTSTAEVKLDSGKGGEPSWVSLSFGDKEDKLVVRDVPALAEDLSGISRKVNVPIRALIGVNLLRHLHPTFDFMGGQFVARNFEAPPPPAATAVKLNYVRGGGMLLRGAVGSATAQTPASLMVDTSLWAPVQLDDGGWQKAGVPQSALRALPNQGTLRQGVVPLLKLGAFDVPSVPGLAGNDSVKDRENWLGIDLDGVIGSGLFAGFRVTLVDGGRTMWLEDLPREALEHKPIDWSDDQPVDDSMYEELDKEDAKPDPKGKAGAPSKPAAGPAKAGAAPKPATGAKP
jgi:predicted small lipoprotein YifL